MTATTDLSVDWPSMCYFALHRWAGVRRTSDLRAACELPDLLLAIAAGDRRIIVNLRRRFGWGRRQQTPIWTFDGRRRPVFEALSSSCGRAAEIG